MAGVGINSGQIGCGVKKGIISKPIEIKFSDKINSIYCKSYTSFAITINGLVYIWGQINSTIMGKNIF